MAANVEPGRRRLIANAIANLARGASAGLVAVILPAVLVRTLPATGYSAWALVLQLSTYIAMLDFGFQVGIGRFIARESAREDEERRNQFFFGGALLLAGCGLAALFATVGLAVFLSAIFPKLTPSLVPECRLAVLLIGASCSLSLPGSAIAGMFIGLERYEVPAIVLGVGRLIQIALTSVFALATHDLVQIALAYAVGNVLMQVAYGVFLFRRFPTLRFRRDHVRRDAIGELIRYCANLSVWNVSMFLVYGLDMAIVAELDFKALAPYSICSNLMAVMVGFMGSAFNVLISRASMLDGKGEHQAVGRLLVSASKVSTSLILAIGVGALLLAAPVFDAWVGPAMRIQAMPFFWVLLVSNGLRLLLAPYATVLMGTGEHKWATVTTLSEGVSNLVASIVLGRLFGPIGVAYGTMVGAVVGLGMAILFTFPRALRIDCTRREYLTTGFLRPAIWFVPLAFGASVYLWNPGLATGPVLLIGFLASVFLVARSNSAIARWLHRGQGATQG